MRHQPVYKSVATWFIKREGVRHFFERGVGQHMSSRYVAGERLDDALAVVRKLNAQGITVMLNYLGEHVTTKDAAAEVADAYVSALDAIENERFGTTNIAIKPTQLGLDLDMEACIANGRRVVARSARIGAVVEIDMEYHVYVDRTLDLYRALRTEFAGVALCIQAYLYRSREDVRYLAEEGGIFRLVKGGQVQPPSVAYARREDVDRNYVEFAKTLLSAGCEVHFATHNYEIIDWVKKYVADHKLPHSRLEFQMLYGVRPELQRQLANEGFRVRVYTPYGSDWYPYLSRRLAERPDFLLLLARQMLPGRLPGLRGPRIRERG